MEKDVFCRKMTEIANKNKIMLSEEQIDKFYEYMNLLIEWNEKINLTAIIEPDDIIEKHFIDSLTILPYLSESKALIDIGTGAGFPGIPVSILNSNIKVTLLDSLNKRVIFLNEVIEKLNLENISAIHSRAEDYNANHREQCDIAVSRAVANMSTLVEYLLPYVKVGGFAICMKGPNVEDELNKSKKATQILGGEIIKVDNFKLGENERNIIVIKKIKNTPKQYPRKAGKPAKEPIV